MLKPETILKEAGRIYAAKKRGDGGTLMARTVPPEIQSDQVKALCEAMCKAVNEELARMEKGVIGGFEE